MITPRDGWIPTAPTSNTVPTQMPPRRSMALPLMLAFLAGVVVVATFTPKVLFVSKKKPREPNSASVSHLQHVRHRSFPLRRPSPHAPTEEEASAKLNPRPMSSEGEILRACDAYTYEIYFKPDPQSIADRAILLNEIARRYLKNTGQPLPPAEDRHDRYHLADRDDNVDRITVLCERDWDENRAERNAIQRRLYGPNYTTGPLPPPE